MKLFLDTVDPREARACFERKVIDGVTTSLAAADRMLPELCACAAAPISARVDSRDHEGMLAEARALAQLGRHVIARLPLDVEGLKAARACADEGIPVHLAGCDAPVHALLAGKAGARYVSPMGGAGVSSDTQRNELIRAIAAALRTYRMATEVLVAPVRTPGQVVDLALAGAAAAAVSLAVLEQVLKPLAESSGGLST